MEAAALSGPKEAVEVRVGTEDPEVEARRITRARGMTSGRVIVHSESTPRWSDQTPVSLMVWFEVLRPGEVRWTFATAGGRDGGY